MAQLKICAVLFSLLLAVLSVSALPFLPASSPSMNSEEKREGRLDALILAPGSHAASFAQNSHSVIPPESLKEKRAGRLDALILAPGAHDELILHSGFAVAMKDKRVSRFDALILAPGAAPAQKARE